MKLITKHDYIKSSSHIKNSILYADSEKETDHIKVSLDYVNTREGSYGLFNNNGKMNEEEINNDYIAMQNKNIHRIIFSQKEEDSKLNSYNDWKNFVEKNIDKIAKAYGVSVSTIRWNAGFHDKEGQPHLHLHLWTDDEKTFNNKAFINKNGIESLRKELIEDLYKNEIKEYNELIKLDKRNLLKQLDSFKNILNLEFDNEMFRKILKDVNYDSFKYQRYYQYLDSDRKKVIDKIVLIYLNENKVFDKIIEIENKVDEFMYEFYGQFDNTDKHINKYLKPSKEDRKELQNHILKMFAHEKINYTSKNDEISRLKKEQKDMYNKISISRKILNSSLISDESLHKEKHNSESKNYSTRRKNKLRNKNSRRNNIRY